MPGSVYVPIADDQARNRTLRPTLNQSLRCTFLKSFDLRCTAIMLGFNSAWSTKSPFEIESGLDKASLKNK
jgi:hypothetical protein